MTVGLIAHRWVVTWGRVGVVVVALVALLGAASSASASAPVAWRAVGRIDRNALTGVSCPRRSLCVAVDSAGNAATSTMPADARRWTITKIDGSNHLSAVSCPVVSLCVAVDRAGNIVASTNPAGGSTAWRVAPVDSANRMSAVSCPSVYLCVAVDNAGNSVVSSDPAGPATAWTVHHVDDQLYYECFHYGTEPCQPPLVGVSCPAVSLCVAVDDAGWALGSTTPSAEGAWSYLFGAPGGEYFGVSCVSQLLCVGTCPLGVDYGGEGGCNGSPGASYYSESVVSWNPSGTFGPWRYTTISPNEPAGVWCRSGPLCFASDAKDQLYGSTDPAGGASSAWALVYVNRSVVSGLSCPSVSACIAVDSAGYALVGGPPPTRAQIKTWLLGQLAPSGGQSQVAALLRKNGYRFMLNTLTAGRVVINWYDPPKRTRTGSLKRVLIATGRARFSEPTQVKLLIKLTATGKRILMRARKLTLIAKGTYTPAGQRAIAVTKMFTLKR